MEYSKTGLSSLMFDSKIKSGAGKSIATHVKMGEKFGSFYIEDDCEFLRRYYRSVKFIGFKHCILERQQDIGPVTVDVDLKSMSSNKPLYNDSDVLTLARNLQKCFKKLLDDVPNLDCFVLEKPGYKNDKGEFKNGFHLHFPNVWLPKDERMYIYSCINAGSELKVDTNVSNWFVYGSKKSETADPYLLSYIIEEKRKRVNNNYSLEELIYKLSIRMKPGVTVSCFNEPLQPKPVKNVNFVENAGVLISAKELRFYVKQLDIETSKNYLSWRSIGCAIFSSSKGKKYGYRIWHEFSKTSTSNYCESSCDDFWESLNGKNTMCTLGTIIWYGKNTNENFKKFDVKPVEKIRYLQNIK